MKTHHNLVRVCLFTVFLAATASAETLSINRLPLAFEENRGQVSADIRFLARGDGFSLALGPGGAQINARGISIRSRLAGADAKARLRGEERLTGVVNYLRGAQSSWITDVPTFGRVRYENVYPGIDVAYYGKDSILEYDFIVAAGRDPDVIALHFDGMESMRLDADGNLVLQIGSSELRHNRPIAYQETQNGRVPVEARYRLLGGDTVRFSLGHYDRKQPLVIDPSLSYSTLFGGALGDDDGRAIVTDSSGDMYVAGATTSADFLTANALQSLPGGGVGLDFSDAFVMKLNSSGTALIYSTYLGGSADDAAMGLAIDTTGSVFLGGMTTSTNFPTTQGVFRTTCNTTGNVPCEDGFVTKLSPTGGMVYSSYLGGSGSDEVRGVAYDSEGNAVVVGNTDSANFPVAGVPSSPVSTSFITRLSPTGQMVHSLYLGPADATTDVRGVAVRTSVTTAYVTGSISSASTRGKDAFILSVTRGTPASPPLVTYLSVLGGGGDDSGNAVTVDSPGPGSGVPLNIYVTGQTSSIDFPTTSGGLQREFGSGPLFRSTNGGLVWSATRTGLDRSSFYALAATGANTFYAGADDATGGGIFRSTDGGVTWTAVNSGLANTRTHALAADPNNPAIVYAGTLTAGIYKTTNGGTSWSASMNTASAVTSIVVDPSNSNVVYAATAGNGVLKTTNAGATWTEINSGLFSLSVRSLVVNPVSTSTLFAGTANGVFRTTNGGASWVDVSGGLFDPDINALLIDPRNTNILYAATATVGVFRSTNAGAFWFPANGGLTGSLIVATALAIEPVSGVLFAAVGESSTSRVYRSTTGLSWSASGLTSGRVTQIAINKSDPSNLIAATLGATDAFVAKWNTSGTLLAASYLGGAGDDSGNSIAVDPSGTLIYVTGSTNSENFPLASALQPAFSGGSSDAFVAKLNGTGATLQYSTYLGGGGNDVGKGIAIQSAGNAAITGQTSSADFPVVGSLPAARTGLLDAFIAKINETGEFSYSAASRGAYSITSTGSNPTKIDVGYARVVADSNSLPPSGLAIFSLRQAGILVGEATVPATAPMQNGRIYAEIGARVNTGLAIANPNNQDVTLNFYFTDEAGQNFGQGSKVLAANTQLATFLTDDPYFAPSVVQGTFTFTATAPIAVIALRGYFNERSEFLTTTLPVTNLAAVSNTTGAVFPHFADGAGWTTQFVVINPTSTTLNGRLLFFNPSGAALTMTLEGQSPATSIAYSVPPNTSRRFRTTGATTGGSVRLVPDAGNLTPEGVGVFSFKSGAIVVTEAGVPALVSANGFRLYAQALGIFGNIGSAQTGIAIANSSSTTATINLELTTLTGVPTGLTDAITLAPNAQRALFIGQLPGFVNLPIPLQGILRVTTASPGVSMIGIRGRYNERSEFLITTTLPAIEGAAPASGSLYFPHFADGGGYTTQFILFNGATDQPVSGSLQFFDWHGAALSLPAK